MEALFKIKASEFNETLFEKIKSLIKGRDIEITIDYLYLNPQPLIRDISDLY